MLDRSISYISYSYMDDMFIDAATHTGDIFFPTLANVANSITIIALLFSFGPLHVRSFHLL